MKEKREDALRRTFAMHEKLLDLAIDDVLLDLSNVVRDVIHHVHVKLKRRLVKLLLSMVY